MENKSIAEKLLRLVIAVTGWFALITQFYINANLHLTSTPEMVIRYFSYFTILTNLLVAVYFSALLVGPSWQGTHFLAKRQTVTAITVYIIIVGLIYNLILRFTWHPEGLQRVVDELLHSVIPVLVLVYWMMCTAKDKLPSKSVLPWLIYPFVYIIYVLLRGSVSGFYPYPFIDVKHLGWNNVLINAAGITAVFIIMSLLLVAVGNFISSKRVPPARV